VWNRRDVEPPDALTLIAFGAIPVVLVLFRGGVITGATGIFPLDQLQYLAWIRDLSSHWLADNSFDLAPSEHVFTDPFFALSGGLVRIGLSPALSYLLWLPVAAVTMLAAYRAYVQSLLPGRSERIAALVLALFAVTPLAPVLAWVFGLSSADHNQLALAVADSAPALQLWGYFPIALTLVLVCVSFLAIARALDPQGLRSLGAETAIAAGAAALAGWLHPWQGVTVLIVVVALAGLDRSRRAFLVCGIVGLAACLPLVYYYVLPHIDDAWSAARDRSELDFSAWVMPTMLLPLAIPAALGVRRPGPQAQERVLLIWPLAAFAEYLLDVPYSIHALETASLPLAVLAVRGVRRFDLSRAAAVALVALATVPGVVFAMTLLTKAIRERPTAYALREDDARALRDVDRLRVSGGVLAPTPVSATVPSRTGHDTWLGHPTWTPDFRARERAARRFFAGRMSSATARRFVRSTEARIAVAPCGSSGVLERELGAPATFRRGCARVFVLPR
jgi:hypothetical protein